jgi:hypothetical protein
MRLCGSKYGERYKNRVIVCECVGCSGIVCVDSRLELPVGGE